jgi:hypothetical protein
MTDPTSYVGTESVDSVETSFSILRSLNTTKPRTLFKRIPEEQVAEIWRATRGNGTVNRLFLKHWVAEDRLYFGPKGTYAELLDFPGYRVSLMTGGVFSGWKRKRTWRYGIFATATLIFGKTAKEFPEVFERVWTTWEQIRSGELREPESSDEEIRAFCATLKGELIALWSPKPELITTVVRRAPTAKKLWEAVSALHYHFPYFQALLYFLRDCEVWDNESYFRIVEIKKTGRSNRRRGGQRLAVLLERT